MSFAASAVRRRDRSGFARFSRSWAIVKRIRSAGYDGSIATRLFAQAWDALLSGVPPINVVRDITSAALCAARLGDLDAAVLREGGLDTAEIVAVRRRAFDAVAEPVDGDLRDMLRDGIGSDVPIASAALPRFVAQLQMQPRAGLTCPGTRRIILEPPENHADHCLVVAVYGVLLCPHFGADPARVFVAALAHHLHNASLPDAGFAGENLLGEHLDELMRTATTRALAELPEHLRAQVIEARRILLDAETADGRAFHAADVIDRVLQIGQHLQAATLTIRGVLDDMHLVHDGPVKAFHDAVLAQAGLA